MSLLQAMWSVTTLVRLLGQIPNLCSVSGSENHQKKMHHLNGTNHVFLVVCSFFNSNPQAKQAFFERTPIDWGIVALDRQVPDDIATPFVLDDKAFDVNIKDEIYVLGHPDGLALKIAGCSNVIHIDDTGKFVANLDTFHGNSGSPVFNERHEPIGVLVAGPDDCMFLPFHIHFLDVKQDGTFEMARYTTDFARKEGFRYRGGETVSILKNIISRFKNSQQRTLSQSLMLESDQEISLKRAFDFTGIEASKLQIYLQKAIDMFSNAQVPATGTIETPKPLFGSFTTTIWVDNKDTNIYIGPQQTRLKSIGLNHDLHSAAACYWSCKLTYDEAVTDFNLGPGQPNYKLTKKRNSVLIFDDGSKNYLVAVQNTTFFSQDIYSEFSKWFTTGYSLLATRVTEVAIGINEVMPLFVAK